MIHIIHTCAIVLTGSGGTLINVQVTVVALKSRYTETLIGINPIFTDGSIVTRLRMAFISIHLTKTALVPSSTPTSVPSVRDVYTSATILACLLRTSGHIILADFSSRSKRTVAGIAIDSIYTIGPDAFARIALTFIHILSAVGPCKAIWAVAGEIVSPRLAGAVCAWCHDTGIIQLITVFAHVPNWPFGAQAHIVTQMVKTCGTIAARR